MTDAKTTNDLVDAMRDLAQAVERHGPAVQFPAPEGDFADEDPFVDAACEAIERGGLATAASIAALVYYIADMMEE